jgi:DeoR/GlpR family transcriptional regulator of sugar metabolism
LERRFAEAGLNDRQAQALSLVAERGQITLSEYAQLIKVSKRTLQRDLQGLAKKGLLIKHGTGKATWYEPSK